MSGNKYLSNNGGVITEVVSSQSSAGVGDAGKIIALDSTGRIDTTMMPIGSGTETDLVVCSENLSSGDFVNYHLSTTLKCRKADGSTTGKQADGFVLAAYTSGETATVYRISQSNTALTGMTIGAKQYLSVTTPGGHQETVPSGTGQTLHMLGIAKSATELIFAPNDPIVLA